MPLHPQAEALVEQFRARYAALRGPVTLEERRRMTREAVRQPGPEVGRVWDEAVPAPDGPVPVRVYLPAGGQPQGALVWYHGGGWTIGDIEMADPAARRLCRAAGCAVVNVGYRLAPETRFPGPAEDAYAAARWTAQQAERLGFEAGAVAVGGDSAGGNLAAAVALMARDRGGPALALQALLYPVLDHDFTLPSYTENNQGYVITRAGVEEAWRAYLADPRDAKHPYAAPNCEPHLAGVAPALIITAEYDVLRDEGEAYARRLAEAGVPARAIRYTGMVHGFFSFPEVIDAAGHAAQEVAEALRLAFRCEWRPAGPYAEYEPA